MSSERINSATLGLLLCAAPAQVEAPPFIAHGKQLLRDGIFIADFRSDIAAQAVALWLNHAVIYCASADEQLILQEGLCG